MKTHVFEQIEIPFQTRTPKLLHKQKPIMGFDTETVEGKTRLITAGDRDWALVKSWDEIIAFLCRRKYHGTVNGFWNLDFDFTGMLKYLPREIVYDIYKKNRAVVGDVSIRYIPHKCFSIKKDKRIYHFYDFAQFFAR